MRCKKEGTKMLEGLLKIVGLKVMTETVRIDTHSESWREFRILAAARMDENADANQAIFEPPPENWRRPPGRQRTTWMKNTHDDLPLLDLGIH